MRNLLFGITLSAVMAATTHTPAADWPCFLGPDRNSVSQETGLLKQWPAEGPKELWSTPLGDGYSSVAVVKGRVYTMYQDKDKKSQYVVCLDAKTGDKVWETPTGEAWTHGSWPGPRDTPTIDGDVLYAYDAHGVLVCLKIADGSEVWKQNILKKYEGKNNTWGMAMSPLIVGDVMYVDAGEAKGASVLALNKKDGSLIWKAHDYQGGYASPEIGKLDGKEQVIFFTGNGPIGVSPKDGTLYWHFPWKTDYDIHASKPILFDDNRVLISSGYGTGSAMIKVTDNRVETLWTSKDLESKHGSILYLDGYLYGNANRKGFRCVDPKTGAMKWNERGFGEEGTFMMADGLCYALSDRGNLVLAKISPEGFEKISEFQPLEGKQCWAQPVVSDGRLFVRDAEKIRCYDVKAR